MFLMCFCGIFLHRHLIIRAKKITKKPLDSTSGFFNLLLSQDLRKAKNYSSKSSSINASMSIASSLNSKPFAAANTS